MALTNNTTIWKFMAIIVACLFILFYGFYAFSSIFIVFIFGGILIMASKKSMNIYNKLFEKVIIPKWIKSSLGFVLVFMFIIFTISLIGASIGDIINTFQDPKFGENPLKGIYEQNIKPYIPQSLEAQMLNKEKIEKFSNDFFSIISSGVSNVGTFLFYSLLIIPLMFAIYFKKKDDILKNISNYVPKKFHKATKNALSDISEQMKDYFNAKMLESTVIGFICAVGFYFIGLEGWLFLGVLAGFLNIVPYIGPVLGGVLPTLVAITHGINQVYWTIGIILFAQIIDNFYLIPFMIADKVKMDSLLSIVLILVASQAFGAFGMIFIIPFYLVGKIILTTAYRELIQIYDK